MKTMPATQARANISSLLDDALAGTPVILTRNGRPAAVVLPASFLNIGRDFPADEVQAEPAAV